MTKQNFNVTKAFQKTKHFERNFRVFVSSDKLFYYYFDFIIYDKKPDIFMFKKKTFYEQRADKTKFVLQKEIISANLSTIGWVPK